MLGVWRFPNWKSGTSLKNKNLTIFFALYKNYCYLCSNKIKIFAMETTKTEDKKMKRYKVAIWVWLILTAAAYINAVIDIINVIKRIWE